MLAPATIFIVVSLLSSPLSSAHLTSLGFFDIPVISRVEDDYKRQCGNTSFAMAACSGFDELITKHAKRYVDGNVLVLDMNGKKRNGLGNSIQGYVQLMATGLYSSRAAYLSVPDCSLTPKDCTFDPSEHLEGRGFDWSWSESRVSVQARMNAKNIEEVVFTASGKAQFTSADTLIEVRGDILDLLDDPRVRQIPWVTVKVVSYAPMVSGFVKAYLGVRDRFLGKNSCKNNIQLTKCMTYVTLQPKPSLRQKIAPMLLELGKDGGEPEAQGSLCVHTRVGFADFSASSKLGHRHVADYFQNIASLKLAEKWELYDAIFSNCPLDGTPVANPYGCVKWGASNNFTYCVDAPPAASGDYEFEARTGSNGTFSFIATCLGRAASVLNPGGALLSNWSVFIAGDMEGFASLLNETPSFSNRVVTSPGEVGHTTHSAKCRINATTGLKDCVYGSDPGGAWSKSLIDLYMLGLCREIVHIGSPSSFMTAAGMRIPGVSPPVFDWGFSSNAWKYHRELIFQLLQSVGLDNVGDGAAPFTIPRELNPVVDKSAASINAVFPESKAAPRVTETEIDGVEKRIVQLMKYCDQIQTRHMYPCTRPRSASVGDISTR